MALPHVTFHLSPSSVIFFFCGYDYGISSPGSPADRRSPPTEVNKCTASEPITSVRGVMRGGTRNEKLLVVVPELAGAAQHIFGLLRKASGRREINAMLMRCPKFAGGV